MSSDVTRGKTAVDARKRSGELWFDLYSVQNMCLRRAGGKLIAPWRTVAEELVELWLSRPHIRSTFGVLGTSNQRQPLENVPE
jgi:hypothetical protein